MTEGQQGTVSMKKKHIFFSKIMLHAKRNPHEAVYAFTHPLKIFNLTYPVTYRMLGRYKRFSVTTTFLIQELVLFVGM